MTGPDGGAWYFITPEEKEERYGPQPERPPRDQENDDGSDS